MRTMTIIENNKKDAIKNFLLKKPTRKLKIKNKVLKKKTKISINKLNTIFKENTRINFKIEKMISNMNDMSGF
jgi:hypothetical protein